MEPLERLLNLVGLLLETRMPLTFEQIRETLEPYRQENVDSAKRMFERDKDILRDYGVPLELVDTDAWGTEQGYVIPKDAYYLPEIAFTPEELGALFVAAQGVRNDTPAEEAVRKLMVGRGGRPARRAGGRAARVGVGRPGLPGHGRRRGRAGSSPGPVRLPDIQRHPSRTATSTRTRHSSEPGTGTWSASTANGMRLDRSGSRGSPSDLTDAGEGSEPPDGFRAADLVVGGPWTAAGEERATIALSPDVAWWATGTLVGAEPVRTRDDGWVEITVPLADERELAPILIQLGPDAVVEDPPTLRDQVVARLEALLD